MSIVEAETLVRVVVFGFWLDEIVMGSFLLLLNFNNFRVTFVLSWFYFQ